MKQLTIAIDFDDTLTAAPELFSGMVELGKSNGHRFIVVTARRQTEENTDEINAFLDHWGCQMPIVFSSLGSKLHAVEKWGIEVDIWIDDDPTRLVHGH